MMIQKPATNMGLALYRRTERRCSTSPNHRLRFRLTECIWAFEKVLNFGSSTGYSSGLTFFKFRHKRQALSVACNYKQTVPYCSMTKNLLIRLMLILLTTSVSSQSFCQSDWDIVKEAKTLPAANNMATVKGFAFDKTIYISKDTLNNGFTIELQDPSYKIVFFRLYYECEDCDIWVKTIYGNKVTLKDAPILKGLKKGEILGCTLFKVEKAGKFYTLAEVTFIIAE